MPRPNIGTIVLYVGHKGGQNVWPAIVTGWPSDDQMALSITVFPEDEVPFALLRVQPLLFHHKEDRGYVGYWVWATPQPFAETPSENG